MILLAIALAALPRPNVVLVTIDTLRADHVGSYGAAPGSTPALDALASEGLRFENAISPAPLTRPAHASLLTGLYPPEHGIRDNLPGKLDSSIPTLAIRLEAAGYQSTAERSSLPGISRAPPPRSKRASRSLLLRRPRPDSRPPRESSGTRPAPSKHSAAPSLSIRRTPTRGTSSAPFSFSETKSTPPSRHSSARFLSSRRTRCSAAIWNSRVV